MVNKTDAVNDFPYSLDEAELFSRIENVLRFAHDNINQIDLNSEIWKESIGPYISLADKVIIETSLLTLIVRRIPNLSITLEKVLNDLGKSLCPQIRNEHNKILLMRNPQTAAIFGIGHAALCSLGYFDDDFDFLTKISFENGEVFNTERIPYRIMDVIWLNNLMFPNAAIAFDNILPHSILMSKAHPVYMTSPDIYAITHSVMYITDFGTKPLHPLIDKVYLSNVVDSAIAYHLLSDNLDILGELIMTVSMMGIPWSPYVKTAWILLTNIWDKLGFLPCPTFNSSTFKLLSGEEASSYAFKHLYHTTYVGGILSCLLLSCKNISENNYSKLCFNQTHFDIDKLLMQIENSIDKADSFSRINHDCSIKDNLKDKPNKKQKYFKIELENDFIIQKIQKYFCKNGSANFLLPCILSNPELKNEELFTILTDSLLIHSVQDYNLPLLIETLSYIVNRKIPITLTTYKTIEFIINQQLPSGAISAYFVIKNNLETSEACNITSELTYCLFNMAKYIRENKN